MNAQRPEAEVSTLRSHVPKIRTGLRGHNSYNIPKIANKEIPLHHFGVTFDSFSLAKHHRCQSKVWHLHRSNEAKHNELSMRTNYNRPVHLLKEYLERK